MKNNLLWADLCRILATFGVIVIHASGSYFHQFNSLTLPDWYSVNILQSLVRVSVPLFFMLSGALLLNRDNFYTISSLLSRILRIAMPLFVWSIIYLIHTAYYTGESINILSIAQQPAMYHLWFVYALIGVYLLLPLSHSVFNTLAKNKQYCWFYFLLWLFTASLPIYFNIGLTRNLFPNGFLANTGYFILGGIISHYVNRNGINYGVKKHWAIMIFIGSVLLTSLISFYFSSKYNQAQETAFIHLSPNIVISSILAFFAIHLLSKDRTSGRLISSLSSHSFPIYLVHALVLSKFIPFSYMLNDLPSVLQILVISSLTFITSLVISVVISFIPKSRILFG